MTCTALRNMWPMTSFRRTILGLLAITAALCGASFAAAAPSVSVGGSAALDASANGNGVADALASDAAQGLGSTGDASVSATHSTDVAVGGSHVSGVAGLGVSLSSAFHAVGSWLSGLTGHVDASPSAHADAGAQASAEGDGGSLGARLAALLHL